MMATANQNSENRTEGQDTGIATLVHLAGLLFGVAAVAFIYLVSEDEFVRDNATNALNWHIPVSILGILTAVVGIGVSEPVGVAMAMVLAVATVCFAVVAGVKAYRGTAWRYPVSPRLV